MIIQGSICNNPHDFLSHIYCIFSTFYFPLSSVSYLSGTLILLTFKYIMLHCYVERGNNNLQFLHSVLLLLSNHYISWWLFHCYIMSAEPLQYNSFFFCTKRRSWRRSWERRRKRGHLWWRALWEISFDLSRIIIFVLGILPFFNNVITLDSIKTGESLFRMDIT